MWSWWWSGSGENVELKLVDTMGGPLKFRVRCWGILPITDLPCRWCTFRRNSKRKAITKWEKCRPSQLLTPYHSTRLRTIFESWAFLAASLAAQRLTSWDPRLYHPHYIWLVLSSPVCNETRTSEVKCVFCVPDRKINPLCIPVVQYNFNHLAESKSILSIIGAFCRFWVSGWQTKMKYYR
jgi:hypothetical protein